MKTFDLPETGWIAWPTTSGEAVRVHGQALPLGTRSLGMVACLFAGHKWNHCTCQRCDKVRDAEHFWVPAKTEPGKAKCAMCGLPTFLHGLNAEGNCQQPLDNEQVPALLPRKHDRKHFFSNPSDPYATSWTAH